MDGILTQVIREIPRDEGPAPFTCSDALALRAVSEAHARQMAREAGAIARQAGAHLAAARVPFNPDKAVLAAERHHERVAQCRAFHKDRIRGLRDERRITVAQHRALEEIGDLIQWREDGKQVLARSQFSERLSASTGGVPIQHLLEEAERLRYLPWCAWAREYQVKPGRTLEDLVRAFAVQRWGLRQLANAFNMDQRRAERLLVRALAQYVAIAGWENEARDA